MTMVASALKRIGIDEANDKVMALAGITEDDTAAPAAELITLSDMEDNSAAGDAAEQQSADTDGQ